MLDFTKLTDFELEEKLKEAKKQLTNMVVTDLKRQISIVEAVEAEVERRKNV